MSSKDWWTNERRQAQRERINQIKPWLKSTGAITAQGKAVISMNAFKGKSRDETVELVEAAKKRLERSQRRQLKTLEMLGVDIQALQNSHRGES